MSLPDLYLQRVYSRTDPENCSPTSLGEIYKKSTGARRHYWLPLRHTGFPDDISNTKGHLR